MEASQGGGGGFIWCDCAGQRSGRGTAGLERCPPHSSHTDRSGHDSPECDSAKSHEKHPRPYLCLGNSHDNFSGPKQAVTSGPHILGFPRFSASPPIRPLCSLSIHSQVFGPVPILCLYSAKRLRTRWIVTWQCKDRK